MAIRSALGRGRRAGGGVWVAAMLLSCAGSAAHAACSDNAPSTGDAVVCDATAPNPDAAGIESAGSDITVDVLPGAEVSGEFDFEAAIFLGDRATVTNDGTIFQPFEHHNAISVGRDSRIVNRGEITCGECGMSGTNVRAGDGSILENDGFIGPSDDGGAVIVGAGGSVVNRGFISAVTVVGAAGDITNDGRMFGSNFGPAAVLGSGSTLTNRGVMLGGEGGTAAVSGGDGITIENTGKIGGLAVGVRARDGSTIVNTGRITATGGDFGQGFGTAIVAGNGTTIMNAGEICSSVSDDTDSCEGASDVAIELAGGTNTLTLRSGSHIHGDVQGGTGTDTLVLEETGTEDSRFLDFEALVMRGDDWTLDAAGPFETVAIESGNLVLGGTLGGVLTVGPLGQLGGTGTVGDTVVEGTIAPGDSIGTLTVDGDYTHRAGAVYAAEVNAAGEGDRIAVTGAATLEGGTVLVTAEPGDYRRLTRYTIVQAAGGVTGQFDSVTVDLAFLEPTLAYDEDTITLSLSRNDVSFNDVARTQNQVAVASALDRGTREAAGDFAEVLDVLATLSAGAARAAYDATSGEVHASAQSAMLRTVQQVLQVLSTAPGAGEPAHSALAGDTLLASVGGVDADARETSTLSMWVAPFGHYGDFDGDGNAGGGEYAAGGIVGGVDTALGGPTRIGAALGYARTHLDVDPVRARARPGPTATTSLSTGSTAPSDWISA